MFIQHCVVVSHKFAKTEKVSRISGDVQSFCVPSKCNAPPTTINNGFHSAFQNVPKFMQC